MASRVLVVWVVWGVVVWWWGLLWGLAFGGG